ncbi:GNAT family N-acetyltransferase [Tunturiibacter empetritectus]|uniref:Ribosomal protein S18 acetylase RimI-like enzyme n=1 Tax=Tunturiibacter lichenicola TaxID=2051959 RepID=A0A852VFL1_9BACT|nr:GNAT family N-acetyltransferase [Edaphobacter lichenicola]NYF89234.1 ribosomal protein S18 acetylase RimI-like enzyme [Edaphobacter lichenicola]
MFDLPEDLFANPVWTALHTRHRQFAISAGEACRYPAAVVPFAAVAAPTETALLQLHSLLAPGESVWIVGESYPHPPQLVFEQTLECLQMVLPAEIEPPAATVEIAQLSCREALEMVALTDLAFPGFFRSKTCEMGSYFGVRSDGQLVAMGGERLKLDGPLKSYSEISGVCTHPDHRGKGYAENLIWHLGRKHRRDGLVSWLHVSATNDRAIQLYLRMGFVEARRVMLHRISQRLKE